MKVRDLICFISERFALICRRLEKLKNCWKFERHFLVLKNKKFFFAMFYQYFRAKLRKKFLDICENVLIETTMKLFSIHEPK